MAINSVVSTLEIVRSGKDISLISIRDAAPHFVPVWDLSVIQGPLVCGLISAMVSWLTSLSYLRGYVLVDHSMVGSDSLWNCFPWKSC